MKKLSLIILVLCLFISLASCGSTSSSTGTFLTPDSDRRPEEEIILPDDDVDIFEDNPEIGDGEIKEYTLLMEDDYETYNTYGPFSVARSGMLEAEKSNADPVGRPYFYHNTSGTAWDITAMVMGNSIDSETYGTSLMLSKGKWAGDLLNYRLAYPNPSVIRFDISMGVQNSVAGQTYTVSLYHGDADKTQAGQSSSFFFFETQDDGTMNLRLSSNDPTILATGLEQSVMYDVSLIVRHNYYDLYLDGVKLNDEPLTYLSYLVDKAFATFTIDVNKEGSALFVDDMLISSTTDTDGAFFDLVADNEGDGFIQSDVMPNLDTAIGDRLVEFTIDDGVISDAIIKEA